MQSSMGKPNLRIVEAELGRHDSTVLVMVMFYVSEGV